VMPIAMRSMGHYLRPFELDFYLHRLNVADSFKKAPGCMWRLFELQSFSFLFLWLFLAINRIEQKGKWTAIASSSIGGLPDNPDDGQRII